jgi:hypothetical protein
MIPIPLKYDLGPNPHFPFPRLLADAYFEPASGVPDAATNFPGAIVDTGAPYLIIPHTFHASGRIKIHAHLGSRPYRLTSMTGGPIQQPFVEVGLQFLVDARAAQSCWDAWCQLSQPANPAAFDPQLSRYSYQLPRPVVVQAYLLDEGVRPNKVVVGLAALRDHFTFVMAGETAFLLPRLP